MKLLRVWLNSRITVPAVVIQIAWGPGVWIGDGE